MWRPRRVILNDAAKAENIVRDANAKRGGPNLERHSKAARYEDCVMLDKARTSTRVRSAFPMSCTRQALACMQPWEARLCRKAADKNAMGSSPLQRAAVKYKVATQMGNQGF